jgi:tRNA-dihydrouridine synthase 3
VIGNGDLLHAHDIRHRLAGSGCAAVMVARGALIKPWIFGERAQDAVDPSAEDRLAIYRRYADLALDHWGRDEHGQTRARQFIRWHAAFWCRHVPRQDADGPMSMQERRPRPAPRSALEGLLGRNDDPGLDYLTEELLLGGDCSSPPPPGRAAECTDALQAG